jgi:vacuolar-type H+-ATPase subunit I/STV1
LRLALRRRREDCPADQLRIKYGFWIVVIGLAVVVLVLLLAFRWKAASDVVAVVGSVTGVIGTIVGAFFGVQLGSAGREKAEIERNAAEEKALKFAAALSPEVATKRLNM